MGGPGAGQLAKMVNQICIAGVVQGLAEGLHFAKRAGLDPQAVYEAISKGAAQSWQMDNRWKTMTRGQVRLRLRRRLDAQGPRPGAGRGRRATARELDMTAMVDGFYAEVQAMGGRRWDTSSLVARLEKPAVILETERLVLRELADDDAPFILELLNEPRLPREHRRPRRARPGRRARPISSGAARQLCRRTASACGAPTLKATGEPVGHLRPGQARRPGLPGRRLRLPGALLGPGALPRKAPPRPWPTAATCWGCR